MKHADRQNHLEATTRWVAGCLGACVLGWAPVATAWAQDDREPWAQDGMAEESEAQIVDHGAIVVTSYREPAVGLRLTETEAARAATELVVRLAGWSLRREPMRTPPPDRLTPASPQPWQLQHGETFGVGVELGAADSLTVTPYPAPYTDEGLLAAVGASPVAGWSKTAPGAAGAALHLTLAQTGNAALWTEVANWAGVPETWIQRFAWPEGGVPAWVVDEDTINLPWVQRWAHLSAAQLAAFGGVETEDLPPARALVEWTRLALVQGIFNARLEPTLAARWFGRAWLGAALIEAANPQQADAQAVAAELRAVVQRYSGGGWGAELPTRWLPEWRMTWDFDRRPFAGGETYPPITGAFDYLIRSESYDLHPQANAERWAFLQQKQLEALDRLLLGFKDNARLFESNQEIYNLGAQLFQQNGLTLVAYALDQFNHVLKPDVVEPNGGADAAPAAGGAEEPLEAAWSLEQDTGSEALWLALDQVGTRGFTYATAPTIRDRALAVQLVILRKVETALQVHSPEFDPDWSLSWQDAWPEVRDWMLRLTWAWRGRLVQLGSTSSVEEVDLLWQRAGFTLASPLPGTSTARPSSRWQEEFEQTWGRMRAAYYTGRATEVVDELEPLLANTDQESKDLLILGLHLGMAAGRGDEFLRRGTERFTSGFGKDTMKQYLLSYRRNAAEEYEDYIRPSNTASANDYLARAEWAVRAGNWTEVREICDAYHYGESAKISLLRLMSRWWLDGQLSAEDLAALQGHLLADMESRFRSPIDYFDTWYATFEGRFAGDPAWEAVKAATHFPEVAAASAALKRLREPMTLTELAEMAERMRAIATGFTPEGFTRVWQHGVLEAEQEARGRWVVALTQNFTTHQAEAAATVVAMVRAARPIAQARQMIVAPFPLEGTWLRAAVGAGADPAALADWVATLPRDLWARESVLGQELIVRPAALAACLRQLPYAEEDLRRRVPALSFSPKLVEQVARAQGDGELVGWAAVAAWIEQEDFSLLARCWGDEKQAGRWIDRNAASYAQRQEWFAAWRGAATERTAVAKDPVAATLPDLGDYLTRVPAPF